MSFVGALADSGSLATGSLPGAGARSCAAVGSGRRNQRLGKALESAVKAHNESIGAFDEGVLRKGRRFAELVVGGVDESQLRVDAVEGQVRVSKCAVAEVGALDERSMTEPA